MFTLGRKPRSKSESHVDTSPRKGREKKGAAPASAQDPQASTLSRTPSESSLGK
jgi:hypothetical protein